METTQKNLVFDFRALQMAMIQWLPEPRFNPIKPVAKKSGKGWMLVITEQWPDSVDDAGNEYQSAGFDARINWVTESLSSWGNCSRKSWNMWYFKSKYELEKFKTLYHLKWDQ
jgi:hypothetical protein